MSVMLVGPTALLILLALVGLVVALLINRRTRPVGLFLVVAAGLAGGGLLLGMPLMWRNAYAPQQLPVAVEPITQGVVAHEDHFQNHFGHLVGPQAPPVRQSWGSLVLGGVVLLLIGLAVFGLAKHHGAALPVVGLLAIVLLGAYFVSFQRVEVHQRQANRERLVGVVESLRDSEPFRDGSLTIEQEWGMLAEPEIPLEDSAAEPEGHAEGEEVPATDSPETGSPATEAPATEATATEAPPTETTEEAEAASESSSDGETPLEAMAAKPGVDEQAIADALDPKPAPAAASPAWIHVPIERVGNVVRRVVSEGPHATADVAYKRVQPKIIEAVHDHLREIVAEQTGSEVVVPQLNQLGITPRWIRENIVAEEYYASTDTSVASDMQTVFVRLEFTPRATDALVEAWQIGARQGRVNQVALAASGLLAAMGGIWGLIKIDTATKGYYTKRLFIGVPLAIIGGLTLLGLLVA